jgi:hypothetical protein
MLTGAPFGHMLSGSGVGLRGAISLEIYTTPFFLLAQAFRDMSLLSSTSLPEIPLGLTHWQTIIQ